MAGWKKKLHRSRARGIHARDRAAQAKNLTTFR
jgi:hypothetical protein